MVMADSRSQLILLTGATGFVGRQILRALLEREAHVRLVVRNNKQDQLPQTPGVERVITSADIFAESTAWWANACHGVDTIIHTAWYAEPRQYLHSPKNQECLAGTLRLAEGAMAAKIRRFVGIGTCFEYDLSMGTTSIHTPLNPQTPYAEAKTAAFTKLSRLLPEGDVSFAWCRLFYLYGEGENERRLVPYLRKKLAAGELVELTSGAQIRDYLDVQEAGRMIADIALGKNQGPANICSGVPTTVRELAEHIADQYGRRDLLRFGARPDNAFDPPCVVGVP
jgi:nucleoside-diphosphate-sugar epimerase